MVRRLKAGLAAASWLLGSMLPAATLADDFADFRIPHSRSFGWTADLTGDANSLARASQRLGTFNGVVRSDAYWWIDSDPVYREFHATGAISGNRYRATDRRAGFDPLFGYHYDIDEHENQRAVQENLAAGWLERRYLSGSALALEWALTGAGSWSQGWSWQTTDESRTDVGLDQRFLQMRDASGHSHGRQVAIDLAVGVGRVRNATVVFEERVFEDRLARTGALTRPLSPEARRKLTDLLFLGDSYAPVRDRPARFLWEEIERILREDGALRDDRLDSYSLFRAIEPFVGRSPSSGGSAAGAVEILPRSPVLRLRGFFAGPVLTVSHTFTRTKQESHQYQEDVSNGVVQIFEDSASNRSSAGVDQILGGMRTEFHRPLGPRWQVDGSGRIQFDLEHPDRQMNGSTFAAVRAIATDRWVATAFTSYSRSIREDRARSIRSAWRADYGANLTFFLEDHVQLQLSVSQNQGRVRDPNLTEPLYNRATGATLGLRYRLRGGLDLPGVIRSVRVPGE